MTDITRKRAPAERPGFIERIGHLWLENPARLFTFGWELLRAPAEARHEGRRMPLSLFLRNVARQIGRTLLRSVIPVLALGAVLGLAVGGIVGGLGDLVRTFIDTFALGVIYRLVLPVLVMIILVARAGSAIAGRLATYSLAYPATSEPEDGSGGRLHSPYMSARELLGEVAPLIAATIITAGVSYWILALWLIAGYMSDGLPTQLMHLLAPDNWSGFGDFIRAKSLGPVLQAGTWWSLGFGGAIAYIAAALGTAAGQRIHDGTAEPTDYYDAAWESGAMTLLLCAAAIAFTWKTL